MCICVLVGIERIYDARGVDILAWAGGLSIGTEDSWQVEQIFFLRVMVNDFKYQG